MPTTVPSVWEASPSTGEVSVVDGGGSVRTALMGVMIATSSVGDGWCGGVINGAIRDGAQMDSMDLHVNALATNPRKSTKHGTGEYDVAVQFGGVHFAPGDHLYSDEDGLRGRGIT